MAGYDPNGMAGAVVPSYQEAGQDVVVDGQEGPQDDPRAYGTVAAYGDGKKGGDWLAQTEKLWLFGEKKPLSVQSYGSLPVEVRPACSVTRSTAPTLERAGARSMRRCGGEHHRTRHCRRAQRRSACAPAYGPQSPGG